MDVTEQMRRLERAGFSGGVLDRAIALAGGSRLAYEALLDAAQTAAPEEALRLAERRLANGG